MQLDSSPPLAEDVWLLFRGVFSVQAGMCKAASHSAESFATWHIPV